MARHAKEFKLNENQLIILESIRDNKLNDPAIIQRATVLLALNDGTEINKLASMMNLSKYTIYNWRDNFLVDGINSLQNEAKAGRGGKETQDIRRQIEEYTTSSEENELQNITASSIADKFHTSRYVANSVLKQFNITGERQRVWNVGTTDTPIPKSTDVLGMYLSSRTAILLIASCTNGSLPVMTGTLRTERKALATAISSRQNTSDSNLTVTDLIEISSDYLGQSEVHHHYMSCDEFFGELIVKSSYGDHVEFTILFFSEQPVQSSALSRTLASVQTKTYPTFSAWTEAASILFSTLDRRGIQSNSSDFHTSVSRYIQTTSVNDEPFIWMKHPMDVKDVTRQNNLLLNPSGQTLTTIYILRSANGQCFTRSFKRSVDIPEIDRFELESDAFYIDFDALEKAIIETQGDSLNFAKQYLDACADRKIASGANLKERRIDAEIGNIPVKIGGALLSGLRGKQILSSVRFIKLAASLIQDLSYHKTTKLINQVTHREETNSPFVVATSLSDRLKKAASGIVMYLSEWTEATLSKFGFNPKKGNLKKDSSLSPLITWPDPYEHLDNVNELKQKQSDEITSYIEYYNTTHTGDLAIKHLELINDIELPGGHFVYISPDDVEAKHQKTKRMNKDKNTLGEKGGFKVQTSNVHIEVDGKWYAVTGKSISSALKTTLAIFLEQHLLENRQIIVFSDGARSIKNWVNSIFGFAKPKIIVDWKHIQKKCNEYFSMALNGGKANKEKRGEIKREFYGRLWVGNYNEAIEYIKQLECGKGGIVKNKAKINEMAGYLERKSYGITCFALRRHLKLRMSSNKCEKLNDCDYSQRQKHNGMSWSHAGSHDLATMTATFINEDEDHWFKEKRLTFTFHE